jgi:hypothetical protein
MATQSFKDKQVMYELGDFFRSFSLDVYLRNNEGEEQLMVMDKRVKDLLVSFMFKVIDDGKKVEISTFFINTPFVMIKMCENTKMIFTDSKTGKMVAEMTFYDTSKMELNLDYVLLKFLVKYQAYFLLLNAPLKEIELDMSFMDDLLDRLWRLSPELNEEEEKRLNDYLNRYH